MSKEEREEIEEKIEKLEDEKDDLESQEDNESYDEMLDETKEHWLKNYDGARILKEIDPIAYRCGLNDYNDERLTEIEDEIDELKEELAGELNDN